MRFHLSATPDFSEQQLTVARATINHTDGQAIHTLENLKGWMESYGFVAYRPLAAQLGCPCPSVIEATLGAVNAAPTLADSTTAHTLMTRFVGEGGAVALNLLGSPGEQPDFLVTAPLFPHIFTLRGDKTWKQPPVTNGAGKVSPLALNVYTALTEKSMTAADLAAELGREVTEPAILRALNELWAQLRVLPVYQLDGSATLWELASRRFTKALKAGGNAGVPTAFSALLPFYLAQAVAASEEEVAGFFSPLLARSRTRDVLHALTAARQLETVVVDGKTLLYIDGTLPEFAPEPQVPEDEAQAASSAEPAGKAPRIKRFDRGDRPQRSERPAFRTGKPAFGSRPSFSDRPKRQFAEKSPEGERERRPFRKPAEGAGSGGGEFRKPWQDDRPRRRDDARAPAGDRPARKPYAPRDGGDRPQRDFKPRTSAGDRPERGSFGASRPSRAEGGDRPARREFTPRGEFRPRSEGAARPPRTPFERKPFAPREGGSSDRPRRPFTPREGGGGERGSRPFSPRPAGGGFSDRPRRPFAPREGGSTDRPRRPFAPREERGGERAGRPFSPRAAGSGFGERPRRPSAPREGGSADRPRPPFTPREGGGDGARRPFTPREGGRPAFGNRQGGGFSRGPAKFSGGKPGGRPSGSRPERGAERPPRRKPEGDEQA